MESERLHGEAKHLPEQRTLREVLKVVHLGSSTEGGWFSLSRSLHVSISCILCFFIIRLNYPSCKDFLAIFFSLIARGCSLMQLGDLLVACRWKRRHANALVARTSVPHVTGTDMTAPPVSESDKIRMSVAAER